eukprot:CAMPEP_0197675306 /NCGR_PEP_ID=MMETSP1338-20131121/84705_1 /TAXON_ID=43686 ORGANISM="Pelagodinium beii, Strain RCC1491" /NCGR_SAMPLE_ID=MMETSP1338 /ASSEMBLY_ACC=CAM_ASM_000754 /LENGTH=146 /DNA_ID=CAMNT_0043255839 /DNA_START=66 /DNA_END=502 /DNA_ORIENTATION=-
MAAVLEVGGVDYEFTPQDQGLFFEPGGKAKYSIWGAMPEMQLPDGTRVAEICAICGLLANYYPKLKGATAADMGISMMIGSKMNDLYASMGFAVAMNMTKGMWEDPKQVDGLIKDHLAKMETSAPIIKQFEGLVLPSGKFTSTGTT